MSGSDQYRNPITSSGPSILDANELQLTKKILSLREHYDISDRSGNVLAVGEGNLIQFPAKFKITDPRNGQLIMQIEGKILTKKLMKLIGEELWLEKDGKELMRIYGNFLEHDYSMEMNGKVVAQVHRKWVTIRDSYGISILGDVDHRLVVGATIVVEHIEVEERRNRS